MQFFTRKTFHPKIDSSYPHNSIYLKHFNEFYKEKQSHSAYLPYASFTYQCTIFNSVPFIDIGYTLRNPKDKWNAETGKALSEQRLNDHVNCLSSSIHAFSLNLRQALYNSPEHIRTAYDFSSFTKLESFLPVSWHVLETVVLDYADTYISFLRCDTLYEKETAIIFNSLKERFTKKNYAEKMKFLKTYSETYSFNFYEELERMNLV